MAAALSVAAAQPAEDDMLTFSGGSVRSPDGAWTVSAASIDYDREESRTTAWLSGPGVKRRALMRYERSAQILWPEGSGRVLLIERTIHFSTIRAFPLSSARLRDRIQGDIVRSMAAKGPRLGSIENRILVAGRIGAAMCVSVYESGLPVGKREGSYVDRRGAYRIDLAAMRAAPIAECPGAVIPE